MRKFTLMLMAVMMAAVMVAPAVGADEPSIIDIALSDGDQFDNDWSDFDIVTEAIIATGLDEALDDDGVDDLPFDVTGFLPTDDAFRRLAQDLTGVRYGTEEEVFAAVASLGIPTVTNVLLYHVVEGEVFYDTGVTLDGATVTTLLGATFDVKVMGGQRVMLVDQDPNDRNPVVNRRAVDIDASNGVIHGINLVLRPADL